MTARIVQLALSSGGVPKTPVLLAEVRELGIVGDRHRFKFHGGPLRALCLYSLELIDKLKAEGHPIDPGSTGENVTISGLDWASLASGMRLALGEVEVALTDEATPCRTIAPSFVGRKFSRLAAPGEMRWYCKVLTPGTLHTGDAVRVLR